MITFEVRRSNNPGQNWYFRIVHQNGNILAHSETYVNKADAVNAARTIAREAERASLDIEDEHDGPDAHHNPGFVDKADS